MPKIDDITIGVSPLTEEIYVGTIKRDNGRYAEWGQKRNVTSDFCRVLLEWCPPGYEREITGSDGSTYCIRVEKQDA